MNLARHLGLFSWAVAARAVQLVYSLVFILFVIHNLPAAEFGRYVLVFQAYMFASLLNKTLILNPMLRFASDPDQFDSMSRNGFHSSLLFYILCSLGLWLVAPVISEMLRIEISDLRLAPLLMFAFFLRDFGFFIQQINYRTGRIFVIESIYFLGASAGIVYFALNDRLTDAIVVLNINILAAALSSMFALVYGFGGVRLFHLPDFTGVKKLLGYGFYGLPTGLYATMLTVADSYIVGAIYTPAQVGVYNAAKQIYRVISVITQAAALLLVPYSAKLTASKRSSDIKALFEKSTGYVFISMSIIAVFGWLISVWFYKFYLAAEYIQAMPLLRLMLLAAPFEAIFNVIGAILYGYGRVGIVNRVAITCVVMFSILLFPAAYLFSGTGAAASLVIALVITGVWIFISASREFGSGLDSTIRRIILNIRGVFRKGISS